MNTVKIKDLRPAFCYLVREKGRTRKEVANFFGVDPSTVGDAIKRYEEQGNFGNKTGSGRPRLATSTEKTEEMEVALSEDPHTRTSSTRKLAKKVNVSRWSVMRMLKRCGYYAWKDQERQFISEKAKKKRRDRCPGLLQRFADGRHRDVVFTDEKLFTIEQAHNRQNDRIWSKKRPLTLMRAVQRAVKPKSVMVWAGVGHNLKTPLVFVPQGVKIKASNYQEMLDREVQPWLDQLPDSPVFQQDGAPSHRAITTQDWCEQTFVDFISKDEWPPSSPDLNPMDYAIWSILESRVCAVPHKSVESLMNALKREWDRLDQEIINKVVAQFPQRLQGCIDAEGGHFE